MTVSVIYREFLIEDIIRESLLEGVVLTKDQIDEKLEEKIVDNPELANPFTSDTLYEIQEEEEASSDKINDIMFTLRNDLSVAYRALSSQSSEISSGYNSATSEMKSIEKRIKILEDKIRNLLLVSKNVEGYLDHMSDTFTNKDKVDLDLSTIFADNTVGVATLAPTSQNRISMPVISSDLQFNVITRENLKAVTLAPESKIEDAFTSKDNAWLQRVLMGRGTGSVISELIVRMPDSSAEVSKIIFKPASSDEGNISGVTVQYSDDGLNWTNTDGDNFSRLIGDVTLVFAPVTANFWKFIFNKAGYDEFVGDSYVYEFGAKAIQFYGTSYGREGNRLEGTLITKALTSEKDSEFNRVSLKVCESLPSGTTINYSLAPLTATELDDYNSGVIGINDINFSPIDPLEREDPIQPVVIDFSRIQDINGVASSYDPNASIGFRYQDDYNVLVDFTFPAGVVKEELKVLRNAGDNTLDGGSNTPVKVNRVDNGWRFDGTYYYSEFYISKEKGKIIDFGLEAVTINGTPTSGQVTLSKGFHKIKTHKRNWRAIAPADIVAPGDTPDILYPYNHKYLIEGVGDTLYGVDMTFDVGGGTLRKEVLDPDGIYEGAQRFWDKTLEEVGLFDFTSNIDRNNFGVYALIKDENGIERVGIKTSPEPGLLDNEKLAIITRTVSNDLHKAIVLKAVFNSDDPKTTPVLDEYIIRLGF